MKITVFTPTFNRAHLLGWLYTSLRDQTFSDFEWLIVDDGSTDHTDELVQGWINEMCVFPIRYVRQDNSGKCAAINRGLDEARGELFFVVDSDDVLTKDALEKIALWESELPKGNKYCAVAGNMKNTEDDRASQSLSEPYYDGNLLDRYRGIRGERVIAFYTDIHRNYKYPVFDNEKFMTEAVVWNRMAHDGYMTRFYDDVICLYAFREDGLTRAGHSLFLQNPKGYGLWLREKEQFLGEGIAGRFHLWYSFCYEMSFCEEPYRLTKRQIAEYIGAPLWGIYAAALLYRIRSKRKGI